MKKLKTSWKQVVCSLVSIYLIAFNFPYNKNKLFKTNYWSRDMLNFNFSEKGLWLVSPLHFVYDFSRRMFLLLHSINWPNFIVWLLLLFETLGNMCRTPLDDCFPLEECSYKIDLIKKECKTALKAKMDKSLFFRKSLLLTAT